MAPLPTEPRFLPNRLMFLVPDTLIMDLLSAVTLLRAFAPQIIPLILHLLQLLLQTEHMEVDCPNDLLLHMAVDRLNLLSLWRRGVLLRMIYSL